MGPDRGGDTGAIKRAAINQGRLHVAQGLHDMFNTGHDLGPELKEDETAADQGKQQDPGRCAHEPGFMGLIGRILERRDQRVDRVHAISRFSRFFRSVFIIDDYTWRIKAGIGVVFGSHLGNAGFRCGNRYGIFLLRGPRRLFDGQIGH